MYTSNSFVPDSTPIIRPFYIQPLYFPSLKEKFSEGNTIMLASSSFFLVPMEAKGRQQFKLHSLILGSLPLDLY